MRITIDIEVPIKTESHGEDGAYAYIDTSKMKGMIGMGESGANVRNAVEELLISLRVKLAYDLGIDIEDIEIVG